MILLFFMVKQYYDIYTAYMAFILFGCNHFLVMYNRLAFYENFLLFFSLLSFFMFAGLVRRIARIMDRKKDNGVNLPLEVMAGFLLFIIGAASFIMGFYTKQSINIVILSLLPFALLYFFYSHHRLNQFVVHLFYGIVITITVSYILAGHMGWFDIWFKKAAGIKFFNISLKQLIPLKSTVANFDPIYISFARAFTWNSYTTSR